MMNMTLYPMYKVDTTYWKSKIIQTYKMNLKTPKGTYMTCGKYRHKAQNSSIMKTSWVYMDKI